MVRVRVTERDPSLPHQINLQFKSGQNQITRVFCNCRLDPLGEMPNSGDPWVIYNDPKRHSAHKAVFVPRARHDQDAKVYELE